MKRANLSSVIGKGEMRMKKFSVCVSTTFDGYVEIDASSPEEAIVKAWGMIHEQKINPMRDFDPYTEIPYAEEIKNA